MAEQFQVAWGTADELDLAQKERTAAAPLPTEKTLKRRKNLPYQAFRFALFNVRFFLGQVHEIKEGRERF